MRVFAKAVWQSADVRVERQARFRGAIAVRAALPVVVAAVLRETEPTTKRSN